MTPLTSVTPVTRTADPAPLPDPAPGEPPADPAPGEPLAAAAARFLLDPETPVDGDRTARLTAALGQIAATGTYRHTAAELAHGCRVAWRNHARCVGRLHWKALRVVDRRDAAGAEAVFEACVDHLRLATNGGRLLPVITVLAPRGPDGSAPRIWNPQLVRYAGYADPDGTVVGDPLQLSLTAAAQALGWRGGGGRFDVLPLIVELPGERPRWFELPPDAVAEVPPLSPTTTPVFPRAYAHTPQSPDFHRRPPAG